jgi:F-type H+-transporting ATPase subunit b
MRLRLVCQLRRVARAGFLLSVFAVAVSVMVPLTAQPAHAVGLVFLQSKSDSSTQQELVRQTREAAGEDESAQFKHSPSVQLLSKLTGLDLENAYRVCVALNFLIVALVIFWLSRKNLPGMFRNRTISIQKAMEDARKASDEANRRLAGIEERLSKLNIEIGEMRDAAEKEAAAEEQRIKAAAEADARRIVEGAEQEIAAAARTARRELTAFAADLAVSLAQKQIQVDAATDHKLIHNFAQQLQSNGGERKGGN